MKRFSLLCTAGALALAACSTQQTTTFEADARIVLNDVQAAVPLIGAVPGVPAWFTADLTLADNGLGAILTAVQTTGGTVEAQTLAGLQTAVYSLKASLPENATVQSDASLAATALTALQGVQTASAETQAFTAVAALALAVEQAEQGSGARFGAVSPAASLIADGQAHLQAIR